MLPIDPLLPEIVRRVQLQNNLVIEAAPGAGKTTRVPAALLDAGMNVVVLEPRRLAARLAARFVAAERGERVGESVGYQVRFEDSTGPRTRLRFVTEGVLTRRLLSDPDLRGVDCVILDEFHERHLEGDLALALLRRMQRGRRRDLRIAVMSATLDARPIAAYLDEAEVMRAEGRQYPLEIEYTPHSAAALDQQVLGALERLDGRGLAGHVLVFLPGAFEIRRAEQACARLAQRRNWLLLPLHGDQSPEEQDRAIVPNAQNKIVLATNVAESSITIEGIAAVVDSGLARVAKHSPWSGLASLEVARISQASANQRAGRAGRTGPGRVIRLYPQEDFVRRPAHDTPEILRADLAPAELLLRGMGTSLRQLDWVDAPQGPAVEHAEELLAMLASDDATLREMAGYPLHPRLSRLIVEARRRGVAEDGCTAAALLSAGERLPQKPAHASRSDLLDWIEARWDPRTAQTVRQVRRIVNPPKQAKRDDDGLLVSVLAAFPDRVARRRQGVDLQLASGAPVQLAPSSAVTEAQVLIAVEAEERPERGAPLVRIASAIEPDWLLDLFPDRLTETSGVEWNRATERVEGFASMLFDRMVIDRGEREPDAEAAAALLAAKALEAGVGRFADAEELEAFEKRMRFAAANGGDFAAPAAEEAMRELAYGLKSFKELERAARDGGLIQAMRAKLPRAFDEIAPDRIQLPNGRSTRVHYEDDQPPWIASRLQDFIGVTKTPTVARGRVTVVVRLLAPNQRPVQTTTDLAGFWERLYPEIRKQLSRRYPKHTWP